MFIQAMGCRVASVKLRTTDITARTLEYATGIKRSLALSLHLFFQMNGYLGCYILNM